MSGRYLYMASRSALTWILLQCKGFQETQVNSKSNQIKVKRALKHNAPYLLYHGKILKMKDNQQAAPH